MRCPHSRMLTLAALSVVVFAICADAQWAIVPKGDGGVAEIQWAGETVVDHLSFSGYLPAWKGGRFRFVASTPKADAETGTQIWSDAAEGQYKADITIRADGARLLCSIVATIQPEGPAEFGLYFPQELFRFADGTFRYLLGKGTQTESDKPFPTRSLRKPLTIEGVERSVRVTFTSESGAFMLQDFRKKHGMIRGITSCRVSDKPVVFSASVELTAETFTGRVAATRKAVFEQPTRQIDPVGITNSGFEDGVSGWSVPKNAAAQRTNAHEGATCLRISVSDIAKDSVYITRQVPVQGGALYQATCFVRTEEVEKAVVQGKSARGAVLIVEWADKEGKWFAAGQYSPSLYGSNPWGALSCDQLRAPDEAGFAAVFLALRGTGTAWFDAFKLTRLSRFAVLQSPLDGETINDNTPMFDFQAPHDVEAAQVELSKTADFAEANVRRYTVHDTPWSCPEPLAAGRWHWRVVGSGLEPGVTWHFTQTAPPETDTTAPVIVTSAERIGQPRGRTVHVTVHEGSGVLRSVKATLGDTPLNVSFHTNSGDGEFCVHPEPDGEWPKGLSSLSVVASDPSGNETEAKVSVLNLPKPENAIRIDEEGFYLGPEGREFPFGIYQVRPENMKTVKEAGFDLVHMYTWESSQDDVAAREYLDAAWKHGLRVFIGFDRGNSSGNGLVQGNLDHIVRRVSALCDHPGLFCWYLFDEPEIVHQYISPRNLTRYADLIRTLDPYHPVVVTTWGKRMNLYRKSWDTHWTQAYKDPAGVVKQLQEHQKALLNASPITLLVHAYDRAQSKSGKPFDLGAFQPDPAWLRAAPYAGITQGINGLFWWWYAGGHADWLTIADVPEAWSALAATLSELRSLAPVLTGDGPVITRTINGGDGGPNVETWQKTVENGTTLIAVNTSESDGEVALPITASGPIRSLFGKTRTAAPESGRIRTHFGRYEVRVYQW